MACDQLSREEEAKLAWLARQEVPTHGAYARGMAAAGYPVAPRDAQAQASAQEVAKAEPNPNPSPRP